MTKPLEELHKAWRKANADYGRALLDCDCSEFPYPDCGATDAKRAMDVAWDNYDAAFKAHLDAVAEAAKLKPCESATNQAPPPPLPR